MIHFLNKTHSIEIQPQGSVFIKSLKKAGRAYGFPIWDYISEDKDIANMHKENIGFLFPKYIAQCVKDLYNPNTTKAANIWDYQTL